MTKLAAPESPGLWHAALFYHTTAQLKAAARQLTESAATAGAPVLIACREPVLAWLRTQLDWPDDRVSWADTGTAGANPGRLIHLLSRFAGEHPGRQVWCVQQATWPSRPRHELWEVIRHDALTNLALSGAALRILCLYHAGLPAQVVSCAEATHPVINHDGRWQPSLRYRDDAQPVPPECDQPLPPPPAGAAVLTYRDNLAGLRQLVSARAEAAGLSSGKASDLLIAVGELAANTLAHASGPGTLAFWATGAEVICEVHDSGHITDPLAGRLRPGPGTEGGGRGLWLVHQLCDLVQIRTGPDGTTVRVQMRLTRGRGPRA